MASLSIDRTRPSVEVGSMAFFKDKESFVWRYPEGQYTQFVAGTEPNAYLMAKNGSRERYLRVCEWHLTSIPLVADFVYSLLLKAQSEGMLGVRWAVYQNHSLGVELVRALRKAGFLCVPRVRHLLIFSEYPEFLNSETWQISDSLFSFDL